MQAPLIFISLALAIGVVIGVTIPNDSETPDLATTAAIDNTAIVSGNQSLAKNTFTDRPAAEIIELKRLLQSEISARQSLEQKFEALSEQVAAIDSNFQPFEDADASEPVVSDGVSEASGSDQDWFNEQALIDSGMGSSQASELKRYFEQLQMDRLYLRDQSIRESWDRAKYREEMQAIASREEEFENQLSESAYDSYLYASGQSNRVAVTSVLETAQAGTAGILPGDYILRYDNQPIYNGLDLREATAGGNVSDTIELEVERDGKTIQFYLARGPLGIRMNSVSVAP